MPRLTDYELGRIVYEAIGAMVPSYDADYEDIADWYGIPYDDAHIADVEARADQEIPWDIVHRCDLRYNTHELQLDYETMERIGRAVQDAVLKGDGDDGTE